MSFSKRYEFNQQFASNVYQNGDYKGGNKDNDMLEDGDEVIAYFISVNSQKSDSQSIVLEQDQHISFQFAYYDMDISAADKRAFDGTQVWNGNNPSYQRYLAYNESRILSLTSVQYDCPTYRPKGNITPPNNVEVTPLFSWTDPSGNHQHNTGGPYDNYKYFGEAVAKDKSGDGGIATCRATNDPIIYLEGSLSINGFYARQGPVPVTPTTDVKFITGSTRSSTVSTNPRNLLINTNGVTLRAGRRDRGNVALEITKKMTEVGLGNDLAGPDQLFAPNTNLVIRTDDTKYGGMCFTRVQTDLSGDVSFNNQNSYIYSSPSGDPESYIIGARKFSSEYGINGDNFQISNAHKSIYNPDDPGKENVGCYATGTVGTDYVPHVIRAKTGIIFTGLQPESFFRDTLGIYDELVVTPAPDSSGVLRISENMITGKIPLESAENTIYSNANQDKPTGPTVTSPLYIDTTDIPTSAVIGQTPVANATGGYLLIEVTGFGIDSQYCDNDQNRNICAVLSKQYDSDDYITGQPGVGIPYIHRGNPVPLNSARIRILDPFTKEVAQGLGEDNTIILNVTKNPKNMYSIKPLTDSSQG